jgi:hypothetical protein
MASINLTTEADYKAAVQRSKTLPTRGRPGVVPEGEKLRLATEAQNSAAAQVGALELEVANMFTAFERKLENVVATKRLSYGVLQVSPAVQAGLAALVAKLTANKKGK